MAFTASINVAYIILVAVLAIASGRVAAEEGCHVSTAIEGAPLVLPCGIVNCLGYHSRWFDITNGVAEEITNTGMIDSATGELTVTEVATSDYGGQKYQCTCGTESSCHIIHYPPTLTITIDPPDVVLGSDATITCLAYGGYPDYQDISLFLSSEVVTVQSGSPYHLHNLTTQDAGLIKCVLNDVSSQPSACSFLNVYTEPDIVDAKNSTIQQGRAILSCTVHTNQCRTLLQFFADGVKIEENDERFKRVLVPQNDRDELCGYLIINDVQEEDLNKRYQCMVYANYTTEIPVRSQDLYLIHSPPSTGNDTILVFDGSDCDCTNDVVLWKVVALSSGIFAILGWSITILLAIYMCIKCKRSHRKDNRPE